MILDCTIQLDLGYHSLVNNEVTKEQKDFFTIKGEETVIPSYHCCCLHWDYRNYGINWDFSSNYQPHGLAQDDHTIPCSSS